MTDNTTNIREVVLDVLLEVLENHNLSHIVLKQALEKYLFLERQDRAFITRCVEGTLEYRIQIDAVLDRFSKVKTAKMKPVIREILRMSVYQILYMERVPESCGRSPEKKGNLSGRTLRSAIRSPGGCYPCGRRCMEKRLLKPLLRHF